jgi:hypothetical protein
VAVGVGVGVAVRTVVGEAAVGGVALQDAIPAAAIARNTRKSLRRRVRAVTVSVVQRFNLVRGWLNPGKPVRP